ncbi:hypothetical protein VST7929_02584 [Vibrio stylophorae]|uniref:TMhelix containing protein n=1 Tax=Vibrio stylophorae TaxID=659351 RepID=A0ABN8DWE8_9VIBR|nr:hypothetical protein [Vibrio stylophorae]CAH0534634.1 hypothetical protein VST7929_02584 [Vibrio stylophorae]
MFIFIIWIIFAVVVGAIAKGKGLSGIGFFLLSILLSPLIGLIVALVIPANKQSCS